MHILDKNFFKQEAVVVAQELLGCILTYETKRGILSGKIVETEAYGGIDDKASHAAKGVTARNAVMFGEAGLAYIYLIYGMYHCLNVVTEPEDTAGAVLIRALEPIPPLKNTNGPGKLCKSMQITRILNQVDLTKEDSLLWITMSQKIPDKKIVQTTRIGISVATDYKWRCYIKDNSFVSVK